MRRKKPLLTKTCKAPAKRLKKGMEFEKNLKFLEDIVEKMSDDKLSLNEALKRFEEGMKMVKKCREELSRTEQKVEKLIKIHEDGKAETEPFSAASDDEG